MTELRGHRYTWTIADVLATLSAQRRVQLLNPWFRYPYSLGLAALAIASVVGLAQLSTDGSKDWIEKLKSSTLILSLWLSVYVFYPKNLLNRWTCHERFKKLSEAARTTEWGYHDDGLWFRDAVAESTILWATFSRIVETPETFLFYQGKRIALWLPGQGFPSPGAIPEFVRTTRDHVGEFLSVGDCRWVEQAAPAVVDEPVRSMPGPEADPIVCRYVWDAKGLAEAWKWDLRRLTGGVGRYVRHGILWFLIGMLTIVEVFVLGAVLADLQRIPRDVILSLTIIVLIIPGLMALIYFVILKQAYLGPRARRAFRSIPRGMQFVEWTFEGDRVESRTDLTVATMDWSHFNQFVETPTAFLLYTVGGIFHWVPGHGFRSESEMRRFAELARSRITTSVALGPCRYVGKPLPIETDEF